MLVSVKFFLSSRFTSELFLTSRLLPPPPLCSFQELQEEDDDDEEEEEENEKAPNPPMMVPMADMLNHVSNHNAKLEFTPVREDLHFICLFFICI